MLKHTNDYYTRGQVLAALAAFEDRPLDLTIPDGTVLKRTRILLDNIRRIEEQAQRERFQLYFQIGEAWYDEVELTIPVDEQGVAIRALQKLIPKQDVIVVEQIYQIFKDRPEALDRLQGVTKTHIYDMSCAAYSALKGELLQQKEAISLLDEFVDV